MNKYLVLIVCVFIASCGKPIDNVKNERFNYPNSDFDYDGISNIDEIKSGENPYVNDRLVNNYLGENNSYLQIRLRSNTDHIEKIKFMDLEKSKDYFDERAILRPSFENYYSDLYKLNSPRAITVKKSLYKNILGCISQGQIDSLKVKYGEFSIQDIDIFSDLKKYNEHADTKFFTFNFNQLDEAYMHRAENDLYKTYTLSFDMDKLTDGFCVLYSKNSQTDKQETLSPYFIFEDSLKKYFVATKFLNGMELNQSLILSKLMNSDFLFFDESSISHTKFLPPSYFSSSDQIDLDNLKVGDSLIVKRYVSSSIKYRAQPVKYQSSQRSSGHRENRDLKIWKRGCVTYQIPKSRSKNEFKDLTELKNEELTLNVGNVKVMPYFRDGYYIEYRFLLTEDMIINEKFNFIFGTTSITKFNFSSYRYKKAKHGSCYPHSTKKRSSSFNDVLDLRNTVRFEKSTSY